MAQGDGVVSGRRVADARARGRATVRRAAAAALLALVSLLSPWPLAPPPASASGGIERSVVRIEAYTQRGDWSAPWRSGPLSGGSGSGFVVAGGRIMTNAHVVSDARYLLCFLDGDPTPHEARVAVIGHDCDLALLEPVEPGLLDAVPPVTFGGLPPLRATVETYGYPAGGERLSSTRGVVSRIEMQPYAHSGADAHIAVQTDAAINPGNSGGPVVADGAVVGVAFQANTHLDNVGFFIPVEVIEHFLADAADGRYDGYPDLGVLEPASLENPAARRAAGLEAGEGGARVFLVLPGSSAAGRLQVGDVLLEVEGRAVAADGTVDIDGMRFPFGVLVDRRQIGEELAVRVLRDGARIELRIPLKVYAGRELHARVYDRLPRYFIYAGLVFVPLDQEVLEAFGPRWRVEADPALLHEHLWRIFEEPGRFAVEPVLVLNRLGHAVNANVAWSRPVLVSRVNGRDVRSLADLVEAVERETGPWQVFELSPRGGLIVLEREVAQRAGPEILRRYGIVGDRRL